MARILRETLVSLRELAIAWGPFLLIGIALLVAAYYVLDPNPPRRVVLATGPERSAYAEFGARYAEDLKRFGIQVELRATAGARENLRLLRDPKERVDLAFVQGGASERIPLAEEKEDTESVVSLGSVAFEPVWLFYRAGAAKALNREAVLTGIPELRGWRVNVGPRGSGTPGLTARILDANQVEREELKRSNLGDTEAVVALLESKLDALFLVSAPESPFVQMLLYTPGIRLFEFAHAEAYARRYRYISPVTLPRGVAHLALDVPSRDVPLIATTTSLVAREDTHPALMQLFVQAAARIHSGSGWIVRAGRFPSGEHSEFPLAKDADRYYRSGPPLLQRYLPFSIANLIDRMWVALFSIVAVLIPVSRLVPPLYQHRVRSRVFRWYRNLRQIEQSLERKDASAAELLADLDKLEARAARIVVPLSYADELYALRAHINMVRQRLTRA
ncbi:MAG TPA: TAXI family TRAP transporter solute-binding subunit [Burkholderiales bacterium]|nr:TAXI family TRAP transporter solute-binding subunit [Burkholderiales bacterium]